MVAVRLAPPGRPGSLTAAPGTNFRRIWILRGAIATGCLPGCIARAWLMRADAPDCGQRLPRARAGDGPALGQLLELYRNYLALLARYQIGRRLQGKVDASDLIQETFLEAYRDFPQFRGNTEAELVSWLRRILAFNLANLVGR